MKLKHILALFILGAIITVLGALFKLESWPNSSLMLIVGLSTNILALLLIVVKLLMNKTDKTLNS